MVDYSTHFNIRLPIINEQLYLKVTKLSPVYIQTKINLFKDSHFLIDYFKNIIYYTILM